MLFDCPFTGRTTWKTKRVNPFQKDVGQGGLVALGPGSGGRVGVFLGVARMTNGIIPPVSVGQGRCRRTLNTDEITPE